MNSLNTLQHLGNCYWRRSGQDFMLNYCATMTIEFTLKRQNLLHVNFLSCNQKEGGQWWSLSRTGASSVFTLFSKVLRFMLAYKHNFLGAKWVKCLDNTKGWLPRGNCGFGIFKFNSDIEFVECCVNAWIRVSLDGSCRQFWYWPMNWVCLDELIRLLQNGRCIGLREELWWTKVVSKCKGKGVASVLLLKIPYSVNSEQLSTQHPRAQW